jgi:hypothetical protein
MSKFNQWVLNEFEHIDLKDKRLNNRCKKVAVAVSKNPGQSFGQVCSGKSDIKGAYRFFENENITRDKLLESHIENTIERCRERKEVAAIQDTTYLNLSKHECTQGLGPIGSSEDGLKGLLVHSIIAVASESGEVLGLLGQEVWAREGHHPKDETSEERRQRPRESERWQRGIQRMIEIDIGSSAISICDREGDIYEVLKLAQEHGQRFIIRENRDRLLADKKNKISDVLKKREFIGKYTVGIVSKKGQKARTALVSVRSAKITICPPTALGRKGDCIGMNVVEAYERHAPKGCEPIHWILLTSDPVTIMDECMAVINRYTLRWKIEEFHMGLKTGCHVEERQFKTRKRVEAFLGLSSILSIALLRLRDHARDKNSLDHGLNSIELALLKRRIPELGRNPTAHIVMRAIAQLGGFPNRRSDGDPGWRTLLRGIYEILIMEHGFFLAQKIFQLTSISPQLMGTV